MNLEKFKVERASEGNIAKTGGFVVSLKIFDRKLQKDIIKLEKITLKDLQKFLDDMDEVLKKFQ